MVRVLVTGGAGYIGSHACKELAARGHEPVCLDSFVTGWRDSVRFGTLVEVDLNDREATRQALDSVRPDAVMHFAALSQVGESMQIPGLYWRNNVGGTLNLLDAMREVEVSRLVFSSTAAVYGNARETLIPEHAPTVPTSAYGASKLAVEAMIADFAGAHGLEAMIFRYFNVAGADPDGAVGEWHRPETHLIPLVLDVAAGRREAITIFGADYQTPDGTCIRDYLHVGDLVDAHLLGLERLLAGKTGLTLNLGTGRGYSVRDVIDRARAITGCTIAERAGDRRAGDPARLVADGSRAAALLGWQPVRSDLDTLVADAWAWHRGSGYRQ
jgi:UDP-glucose-4-epimerase GalE